MFVVLLRFSLVWRQNNVNVLVEADLFERLIKEGGFDNYLSS
jgi:hypothetical protein